MLVTFLVNASGVVVEKTFTSQYKARVFINKLKYSKKLTLLSYCNL